MHLSPLAYYKLVRDVDDSQFAHPQHPAQHC